MTEQIVRQPDDGDGRRVWAFVRHYVRPDAAGLQAVLEEVQAADRGIEFALAWAQQVVTLAPGLRTDKGVADLDRLIATLAARENAQEEN